MKTTRKLLLVGLVLVAPLLVSGVMEIADLGRVRAREGFSLNFAADLIKHENGYQIVQDDIENPGIIGRIWFSRLQTDYDDERFFSGTRYSTFRSFSVVVYEPDAGRMTDPIELANARKKSRDYMVAQGYSASLVREIEQPNYSRHGINWPGVYANGLIVLLLLAIPIGLLAVPVYFISPARRRKRRAARGHCPDCDYDLRANADDGCPECGWRRTAGPL